MSKITPSTKLKEVSVSRLHSMTCFRYYFWRYIRNLEPKRINLNFWYGSVLGAGFEQMLIDGKYNKAKIERTIRKASKEKMKGYIVELDDVEEMKIQIKLISILLEGVSKQPFFKDMKMKKRQVEVTYKIMPGVNFYGILDGTGTYKQKPCSFEIKTASRVTNDTLTILEYDKQVYGYPIGLKKSKKNYPRKCCYIIFRKTQKRVKKNQTVDEFIAEIKKDIKKNPEYFFINYPLTLGKKIMASIKKDIYQGTKILKLIHDSMSKEELLSPESWPQQDEKQCLSYGACPFIILCRNTNRWKTYSKLFKMREMRHK